MKRDWLSNWRGDCYVLTEDAFEILKREHGRIAIRLLTNLGRELSRRLRGANRTIYELEG